MLCTRLKVVLATFLLLLGASSAKSISLLRDSDIENSLKELAQPILNAAGINSSNFQILVVLKCWTNLKEWDVIQKIKRHIRYLQEKPLPLLLQKN